MTTTDRLSDEEILEKMATREIKPRDLDKLIGEKRANALRLTFLEINSGMDLSVLARHGIPPESCGPNIELMVGAAQVPLGYVGPVPIEGRYANGTYFIPMATTEGALVASVNRGCSIIRRCKAAKTYVIRSGQTRSLLMKSNSSARLVEVVAWLKKNEEQVRQIAKGESRFLELNNVEPIMVGNNLWLRLEADTKDAMGMNMITFAAENLGNFLEQKFEDLEFVSASGNLCVDKKPSAVNLIKGRGKSVIAEVTIPQDQIKKYLRTSAQRVLDLNFRKNLLGSMISGSYGFNAHFANVIAAIFLATGQDLGHVVEGSQGFTTMDIIGKDLYVAVTLPSIQVGTVGGGTHLPTQRACLEILKVYGPGEPPGINALKFAEITAVAVLAGELSLVGALAARHLGKAHKALNR